MQDGREVIIYTKGVKHFLNQGHKNYIEKNNLGFDLENVLKKSSYFYSVVDYLRKQKPLRQFHLRFTSN